MNLCIQFLSRLLLILVLILCGISRGSSQSQAFIGYTSRVWQMEDGLPNNAVTSLLQTGDGFIWVGTRGGLARFDGVQFTPMRQPTSGIDGEGESISALCQTKDGSLWAGLEEGGLLRWKEGRLTRFGEQEGLLGGVREIVEGPDGSLWIGTANGVNLFKDENLAAFAPYDFLTNAVRALAIGPEGRLLVGTGSGLAVLKDDYPVIYQKRNGLLHSSVRDLAVDRKGNVWIATEAGLSRLQGEEFEHFTKSDGLSGSFVTALHEDAKGNLWIGSYDGLNRMAEGKIVTELVDDEIPLEPVSAFMEDAEGNIWVGTRGGLYKFTRSRFGALTRKHGLNHHIPVSVMQDRSENIWLGMVSGGVNCLTNGQLVSYTATNGLSSDLVLGLHESKDGSIWIGTDHLGGLNRWHEGKFEHFGRNYGFHAGITALFEGEKGTFWIGTRNGLFRQTQSGGRIARLMHKSGLNSVGINVVAQDRGIIWVGADSGLYRHTSSGFSLYKVKSGFPSGPVLSIYNDAKKQLWFGTRDNGLVRMEGKKFKIYGKTDGLFHQTIYEILEDDYGHFWMSSPKGIFRVPRQAFDDYDAGRIQRLPCTAYNKLDGVISTECMGVAKPAACKTRDGHLWFPTSKGMVIIDPSFTANQVAPPVFIEQVIAGQIEAGSYAGRFLSAIPPSLNKISIPPGRGELEFRYTALSFQIPEKVRFKYKLEGVDSGWVDAGARRVATYNNLAPGSYRFRVIACNNDGVWNETGDSIHVTLEPQIWQTWWFTGVIGMFGIIGIGGGVRYVSIRKLRRKLERLEQEHSVQKERARIAQDMHDDFGSRITEALLACEQARQSQSDPGRLQPRLEKISDVVREMADTMDTLVWSVNPRNDSLGKLVSYIQEYSHNLLDLAGIRCRFELPGNVPPLPISSEVRHNLFLALKEALNNAVKYSGAAEICIAIQWSEGCLNIAVQDNGKGFSMESVRESGNGLHNMEKRLRNLGGRCTIWSSPGQGTCIQFEIPISSGTGIV